MRSIIDTKSRYLEIPVFVSHRCNDYDRWNFRRTFESLLRQYNLYAKYGCFLNKTFEGSIHDNIQNSMKQSYAFIAIISKTWSDTEGYPVTEWNWWKHLSAQDPSRYRLADYIGFHVNTERDIISFYTDMVTFIVTTRPNSGYSYPLYTHQKKTLYIRKKDYSIITDRLSRLQINLSKRYIQDRDQH